MLCRTYTATCLGLEVVKITVEVSVTRGVGIFLVGLPDSAVRESLLRVTTALQNYQYRIPGKKTVINMAPANIKKEGSAFDTAIAVALLAASGQTSFFNSDDFLILGELSLDGKLRAISGALPIALQAEKMGFKACIFPLESVYEAKEVIGIDIYGVSNIAEVVDILNGEYYTTDLLIEKGSGEEEGTVNMVVDFEDVKGQEFSKRGLEIAAAGGHNLVLVGPPGSGKSMMAKCLPSILPPMSRAESLETSAIYSVAGKSNGSIGLMRERPFRTPNQTSSAIALAGGGPNALPGELSLAHNGILFIDEMTQYSQHLLDLLRQPLEDRIISISRAKYKVTYPCSFMLIGSMNPCPCGYAGEGDDKCSCTQGMISRYLSRISGPLMDRIDLFVRVRGVQSKQLISERKAESSKSIAGRVATARAIQEKRFEGRDIYTNAQMTANMLSEYCHLYENERNFLDKAIEKYELSARAYSRILKISRTIADINGEKEITISHLSEALQYRFRDFL